MALLGSFRQLSGKRAWPCSGLRSLPEPCFRPACRTASGNRRKTPSSHPQPKNWSPRIHCFPQNARLEGFDHQIKGAPPVLQFIGFSAGIFFRHGGLYHTGSENHPIKVHAAPRVIHPRSQFPDRSIDSATYMQMAAESEKQGPHRLPLPVTFPIGLASLKSGSRGADLSRMLISTGS